jgi:dCMP deaminase
MNWDKYFLEIADVVSKRSPDPNTKHGCVLVDRNNRVLSTGYNGPIQGLPVGLVEFERPQKYLWMIHAEDNAITFSKCDLEGSTAYVTGRPCVQCLRRMVQAGINRIVFGKRESKCITEDEIRVTNLIVNAKNISFIMLNE